jgi:putative SOS response-associated peptidase YedK
MCGRVTLTLPNVDDVLRLLEASASDETRALYRPRFNAAPSDTHFIVTPRHELVPAVWGLAGPSGLLINERAETADRLHEFRDAFERRRVIVPADGFYEWEGPRGERRPLWFRPREGGLLRLAGLAQRLPDGRLGFVILTTAANQLMSKVHDRMPVILGREAAAQWLTAPDTGLLVPAAEDALIVTPVSARVNDVRNDDATLLERDPEPVRRQLTLW